MLFLQVTKLSNKSAADSIEYVRSFGLGRYTTDVDTSVGHGLVVRVLVFESSLSRHRAMERAAVKRSRGERVKRLERRARHAERMTERRSRLLLSKLDCGLLSPRHVCASVLYAKKGQISVNRKDGTHRYNANHLAIANSFSLPSLFIGQRGYNLQRQQRNVITTEAKSGLNQNSPSWPLRC